MRETEQRHFIELISQMMTFYGQDITKFAHDVWWEACKPFALDVVQQALAQHVMDAERGQWCPKPADIIRQIQGTQIANARAVQELVRIIKTTQEDGP